MSGHRLTFSIPWAWTTNETRDVVTFAFFTSLMTYFAFALIETFNPGFVRLAFNLNYILWVTAGLGIIGSWLPVEISGVSVSGWRRWLSMGVTAAIAVALVWPQIHLDSALAKIVPVVTGLIVMALAGLVYYQSDDFFSDQ